MDKIEYPYQPSGRIHIKCMKQRAMDLWRKREYTVMMNQCVLDVLKDHREYLMRGMEKAKAAEEAARQPEHPIVPPKRHTIWWRDKDNQWIPL